MVNYQLKIPIWDVPPGLYPHGIYEAQTVWNDDPFMVLENPTNEDILSMGRKRNKKKNKGKWLTKKRDYSGFFSHLPQAPASINPPTRKVFEVKDQC